MYNNMQKIYFIYKNQVQNINLKNRVSLPSPQMNNYKQYKDFDQHSSASRRSQISSMNFTSPIPLPQDPNRVPLNQEISQIIEAMEDCFPKTDIQKITSMLYNNVIAPKIQEQAASSYSRPSSKEDDSYSHSSAVSKAASIKGCMQNFRIHPNTIQQEQVGSQAEDLNKELKKSLKRKEMFEKREKVEQSLWSSTLVEKGQIEQNLRKAEHRKSQQNKEHHLLLKQKQLFNSQQQQINFNEKKLAARGYCQYGYGLDKLKQWVWQNQHRVLQLDKKRYRAICCLFITQTYRKLEQFLIQDCNRNIKPLTNQELRALLPLLLSAQLKFQEDQYLTLRKFVNVAFDISSVSIFEHMAVKLYIRVQICVRGRIGVMRLNRQYRSRLREQREMLRSPGRFLNQRLEYESIWTPELQTQLIDTIIDNGTIAITRDKLRRKYGENPILSNVKELKARLFKILRIAVKRLIKYASSHPTKLPSLVAVDDDKVKVLIRHPSARLVRLSLLRLYKVQGFDTDLVVDAIHRFNDFCFSEQKRQQLMDKPKEPVINSVNDKIKHNIKESRKLLKNMTSGGQVAKADSDLVFLKQSHSNYQHIVSLSQNDKLHYFRKAPSSLGNEQDQSQTYQKSRKNNQKQDKYNCDDQNNSQMVMFTDDDCSSESNSVHKQ